MTDLLLPEQEYLFLEGKAAARGDPSCATQSCPRVPLALAGAGGAGAVPGALQDAGLGRHLLSPRTHSMDQDHSMAGVGASQASQG